MYPDFPEKIKQKYKISYKKINWKFPVNSAMLFIFKIDMY